MSKPKHFWISGDPHEEDIIWYDGPPENYRHVHVVEFVAYARAIKALKEITNTWDTSHPSIVKPKWHKDELAPNDSLAAMAIVRARECLKELGEAE